MTSAFLAIAPIFLMIGLGTLLKARAGFGDDFWRLIERMTFNGLFPSLLLLKIAQSHVDWSTSLPIAGAIVGGIVLTALLMIPLRRPLGLDAPGFVSVFQCGFRSNTYVGIAIVLDILGDPATGPMAVTLLAVAITINVLGVWGHLTFLSEPGRKRGWKGVTLDSAKNPLILACLAGAFFNVTGLGLPPLITPTLELLSRAALPMGLMAVGAGLSLRATRDAGMPVGVSTAFKLAVQPALTYALGLAVGLEGLALVVPVIFAALPTSSTAYVVSRQMGSDARVTAAVVTATHLAAIVSLPVLLSLIRGT